tara:strand:- start:66 stop:587 length:522 start_codon:yes stop_codon:yes gene_type:complete
MSLFNLAARAGIPAARSALRFLSKMKKPPSGGITVYRGQNVVHRKSLEEAQKQIPTVGRWFTDKPSLAMKFAGSNVHSWKPSFWAQILKGKSGYRKGIIEKMRLSKMEADLARRIEGTLGGFGMSGKRDYEYLIVPKHTLPRVEKAPLLSAIANLRKMMGKYNKGGLARILEV